MARRHRGAEFQKGIQGGRIPAFRLLYLEEEFAGAWTQSVSVDPRAVPVRLEAEGQASVVCRPQADDRLGIR